MEIYIEHSKSNDIINIKNNVEGFIGESFDELKSQLGSKAHHFERAWLDHDTYYWSVVLGPWVVGVGFFKKKWGPYKSWGTIDITENKIIYEGHFPDTRFNNKDKMTHEIRMKIEEWF